MARTGDQGTEVHLERKESEGILVWAARDPEDHPDLQACQVKDGQAARAPMVVLVTRGHRVDLEIQVAKEQQDPRGTVTPARVLDTTLEVNRTMGMITENNCITQPPSSSSSSTPPVLMSLHPSLCKYEEIDKLNHSLECPYFHGWVITPDPGA